MPGKFHAQRNLAGHSPLSRKESDKIEHACNMQLIVFSSRERRGNAESMERLGCNRRLADLNYKDIKAEKDKQEIREGCKGGRSGEFLANDF